MTELSCLIEPLPDGDAKLSSEAIVVVRFAQAVLDGRDAQEEPQHQQCQPCTLPETTRIINLASRCFSGSGYEGSNGTFGVHFTPITRLLLRFHLSQFCVIYIISDAQYHPSHWRNIGHLYSCETIPRSEAAELLGVLP